MNAVTIPIAELSPDPANARRHPTHNLDAIKASLRRFGQQKPIVVDQDNVVRAGNGLLEAAKAIGWTEISVGSTIIAAEQTGRRCCAIELEPTYVQVAIERWQQFTGAEARRA